MESTGYEVLNEVALNQVLVSFGAPEVTLQVVRDIQVDRSCWCGITVWQGENRDAYQHCFVGDDRRRYST